MALVLMALGLGIAVGSLITAHNPHTTPHGYVLVIALGGAVFQEGLYHYAGRVARRTGSRALLATAWDYRLDAFGGLTVALGVAFARWGGEGWGWADHAAAFVVAATVLWVGGDLFWDNIQALMDHQAQPEVLDAVRREASAVEGVLGVEKLRVRRAGLEFLVDIHVEVDPLESGDRPIGDAEIVDRERDRGHRVGHATSSGPRYASITKGSERTCSGVPSAIFRP